MTEVIEQEKPKRAPRLKASRPSRIWQYGAKASDDRVVTARLVDDQLWWGHRFYNKLVEIELKRREKVTEFLHTTCPELASLYAQWLDTDNTIETKQKELAELRAKAKRRVMDTPLVPELKELRTRRSKLFSLYRKLMKQVRTDNAKKIKKIDESFNDKMKTCRADSQCYVGTYQGVHEAFRGALAYKPKTKTTPKSQRARIQILTHYKSIRFKTWTGEGRLAMQLPGGIGVKALKEGTGSMLRLLDAPPRWKHPDTGRWKTLWIRIGSNEKREPIWAQIPTRLHRELPEDADVKWCYVHRRRIGPNYKWSVSFVIQRDAGFPKFIAETGTISMDFGWRKLESGDIRVARWKDHEGKIGELVLSARWLSGLIKSDELQSIRKNNFNDMLVKFKEWLAMVPNAPQWFLDRVATVAKWQSPSRFFSLIAKDHEIWTTNPDTGKAERKTVIGWTDHRFGGDEFMFDTVQAWCRRDLHLHRYEDCSRDERLNERTDIYRKFACWVRNNYHTIIYEKLDLRDFAERPAPESEADSEQARKYRARACLSKLRQCLKETGMEIIDREPQNTTRCCNQCGEINEWEDQAPLILTCSACGAVFDQDDNAAANLYDGKPEQEEENPELEPVG